MIKTLVTVHPVLTVDVPIVCIRCAVYIAKCHPTPMLMEQSSPTGWNDNAAALLRLPPALRQVVAACFRQGSLSPEGHQPTHTATEAAVFCS